MNSLQKKANNKILVVDDEIDVLEFLEIYLKTLNWDITTTASTSEALEYLKKDNYFCVLSDIAMPNMDGYEFGTLIKKYCDSETLFMTGFGYNPDHTLVKIKKHAKYPCLFKPFDRKKLSQLIQDAWQNYHDNIEN